MDPSSSQQALVDSGAARPLQFVMDTTGRPMRNPHGHTSASHYHYNLGRSMFCRRSRNHYGHHYSWQISCSNTDKLNSLLKHAAPTLEDRLSFKLTGHSNAQSGCHGENIGKAFRRPERIRFNATMDSTPSDVVKMVCGICLKLLTRKLSSSLGNTMSSSDLSVVAILACGHAYHANCLEQRTSELDKQDPPCPLCLDMSLKVDAIGGQSELFK
ncbi:uncharacterized protein LOC143878285 isoform X2 [Tasmannia lanceolata]|uniref:uncharacterized protein LOC143878285 isoform X2 n=1 Tax=Tasmannia lanceolata TaxID=3420 RepID=UPI0040636C38